MSNENVSDNFFSQISTAQGIEQVNVNEKILDKNKKSNAIEKLFGEENEKSNALSDYVAWIFYARKSSSQFLCKFLLELYKEEVVFNQLLLANKIQKKKGVSFSSNENKQQKRFPHSGKNWRKKNNSRANQTDLK